jgi:hypothetical protein
VAWGGKRDGAGRKPFPLRVGMLIGLFCEMGFREISGEQARSRYEARPKSKKIQKLQQEARENAGRARNRYVKIPPHVLEAAIAKSAAKIDKLGRTHAMPRTRPKGFRNRILEEAAAKFGVTKNTAERWWKLVRRDLISPCNR